MAKRNKSNIKIHYGIADFFKYYLENTETPIKDYKLFSKIINEINESVSNAIIFKGYEFKMPNILFKISITKKRQRLKLDENGNPITKWLPVDFKATKELWKQIYPGLTEEQILQIPDRKRVYLRNKHSNGYIYSFFLDKFRSNCRNKSVYFYETTRTNARNLSKYIKSDEFKDHYYER